MAQEPWLTGSECLDTCDPYRPSYEAMSDAEGGRQFVTVKMATAMTGIPERTLRRWIAGGQLPAVAAKGGRLVALDDVDRLAGDARLSHGHGRRSASVTTDMATATAGDEMSTMVYTAMAEVDRGRAQLEVFRDTLLVPLIEQSERQQQTIAEQAETIGRLTAVRDALERRVSELEARDELRADSAQNPAPARPRRRWWAFWER